ncbi:MAG: glycosyltransferase family 9 protein [Deltaproteobacteria bacterium]|nr:glycosyltransferase family 9 protein [Deltaproteobacteria bacterium]
MIYAILAYLTYPFVFFASRFRKRRDGSILVFQTAKIGDMICTTPVFREIKKAYPKSRLGVVIDPVAFPVIEHNPYIDEIIILDGKAKKGLKGKRAFAKQISEKGYSTALILMPNVTNIMAAYWAGIPKRIAVYPDYSGRTLKKLMKLNTHVEYHLNPRMSMETFLRSLKHLGIDKYELQKEVYQSSEAEAKVAAVFKRSGPCIGLVLGTGNELKDWGKNNFLTLAGKILENTEATIVLLGSEKDRQTGEELATFVGNSKRVVNYCGLFSLTELPALMRKLSLVIGVDTGLIYMADSLDVPVIDIAGPCDMNDQRPIGKQSQIVQEKGYSCIPCSHTFSTPYKCRFGHKNCVTEITPDTVLKSVLKIIPETR